MSQHICVKPFSYYLRKKSLFWGISYIHFHVVECLVIFFYASPIAVKNKPNMILIRYTFNWTVIEKRYFFLKKNIFGYFIIHTVKILSSKQYSCTELKISEKVQISGKWHMYCCLFQRPK